MCECKVTKIQNTTSKEVLEGPIPHEVSHSPHVNPVSHHREEKEG